MRPLIGCLLASCALIALLLAWGERFAPLTHATFGFSGEPRGMHQVVVRVEPDGPAASLGLRPGDVLDLSKISLSDRYRLTTGSVAGSRVTIPITRGGEEHLITLISASSTRAKDIALASLYGPMFLFTATVTLCIVALIALRHPSVATASLVLYGIGTLSPHTAAQFSWLPNPLYGAVAAIIFTIVLEVPQLALLPFIVRFPSSPTSRSARTRMRVADGIFIGGTLFFTWRNISIPYNEVTWIYFEDAIFFIVPLIILVFAAFAYHDASGEERRRVSWVIAGFVITTIAYSVETISTNTPNVSFTMATMTTVLAQGLIAAFAVTLAYAVLRHRVLDIGFVFNRAAVYAVMTTLVVLIVAFVDWFASRMLTEQRLAVAVEALVTISLGFALNQIHARTERLLDRVVFRQRYIAEKRIEYRIGALGFASSSASIDEALGIDAPQILDLASAAVFDRFSSAAPFRRSAETGWSEDTISMLDPESLLVRTLRSVERPLFLDDAALVPQGFPTGALRPILAIPITAQHELLGVALYGNHPDGASPDPEEVSLLWRLTAAAATAYGTVEARQWRERAAMLEQSIRSLGPSVSA